MKHTRIIALLLLCCAIAAPMQAKSPKGKPIHLFGVSISFVDSLVHVTDIQQLDSVALESKTKFLPHRQYYAMQLQGYLESGREVPSPTCAIYFSKSKKKIEKKYRKVMNRLTGNSRNVVVKLGDDFKFERPNYDW